MQPGTTAVLRGITGDAGKLLATEYAGDLQEWEASLAATAPPRPPHMPACLPALSAL